MLHDIDIGEFKGSPSFELNLEYSKNAKAICRMRDIQGALNRAREDLRLAALACEEEVVRGNIAGGTLKKDILELWVKTSYVGGQMATMIVMLEKAED